MLTALEIDLVNELCELFKDRVSENTQTINQGIFQKLKNSPLLSDYYGSYFYKSFRINNSLEDSYLLLFKNSYLIQHAKQELSGSELQVVGIKTLSRNFGNLLIRPERIEDKVIEFFSRTEIDFEEFPSFSTRYYFLADDENSAYSFATRKRIQLIENQKEILIQVLNNTLMAKFCRRLTHEDFGAMIGFIEEID